MKAWLLCLLLIPWVFATGTELGEIVPLNLGETLRFFNVTDGLTETLPVRSYQFEMHRTSIYSPYTIDDFVLFLFSGSIANLEITGTFNSSLQWQNYTGPSGVRSIPCTTYPNNVRGCLFSRNTAGYLCPFIDEHRCTYHVTVRLDNATQPLTYTLRAYWGENLGFSQYQDFILRGQDMYYGLEIQPSNLDVEVTVQPLTTQLELDVYMYNSRAPMLTQFFPSLFASNNPGSEAQYVSITANDDYFVPGFFLLRVVFRQGMDLRTFPNVNYFVLALEPNYGPNLLSLPVLAIVSVLIAVVVCGFGIAACFAKRFYRGGGEEEEDDMGQLQRPEHVDHGATQEQINQFPTRVYREGDINVKDEAKCSICLDEYEFNDTLRDLPCGHHFHVPCIDPWLLKKKHCPLCQQDVLTAHEVGHYHDHVEAIHRKENDTPSHNDHAVELTDVGAKGAAVTAESSSSSSSSSSESNSSNSSSSSSGVLVAVLSNHDLGTPSHEQIAAVNSPPGADV